MYTEVRPGVFRFHPPDGGELYAVRTDAGLILIDTGLYEHRDRLVAGMQEAGLDPHEIRLGFVTHVHCDHVGGMGWWRQAFGFRVAAHRLAVDPIEKGDPVATGACMPYAGVHYRFVPCPVDERLDGGETIALGERSFHVIHAPGHSPGSIHLRLDDLLFVGDTIFGDGTIGWMDVHWGSHPEDYIETLERMRPLSGSLVLSGHGDPFVLKASLIDRAREIVSFYVPEGHGLGRPRAPSGYARS